MPVRPTFLLLLAALAASTALAQAPPAMPPAPPAAAPLPTFEVATIKPSDLKTGGAVGFYSYPGGRVHMGFSSVQLILYFACDVKPFQIANAPDWVNIDRFDIEAVPPDSSPSRALTLSPFSIAPTAEQRQMLESLLRDRFAFRYHMETREGDVFILSRGTGPLHLDPPKDLTRDWRGTVMSKGGGIWDGEAFGSNISMANLGSQLSRDLGTPVIDRTGLAGTYDFHLPPDDPTNTDMNSAIFDAMHRLGLNLSKGRGPVQTLVIDHVERPSEN